MMSDGVSKITKNFKLPVVPGKYFRLSCLTGKNKGLCYYLTGKRVVLGRGDKVDIQVLDTKSSREHAELVLVGSQFVLTDLGSQNGVVVNDLKVTQHQIKESDKIIIGQTVFKFDTVVIKESKEVAVVDDDNELDEFEDDETPKSKKKSAKKEEKKKPLVLIAVALLAVVFLLPEEKTITKGKGKDGANATMGNELGELIDKKQREEDRELRGKLDTYIQRGLREYREGNYFRAIEEFNLALILSPTNGDANFYLNRTKQKLDNLIEIIFLKAKQEAEALKYSGALISYCEILRLLQDYPEDKRFVDAKKNIEFLEQQMGMEKNEYQCF